MSDATETEVEISALRHDIAALKRDVGNLLEHLKAGATDGARNAAEQLEEGVQRLYKGVATESERSAQALSKQIEEQPLTAVLIALGIGYLGGKLFSR